MATNKNNMTINLDVEMKMGILKTIANQIYADPKVKIREAVANSMDNDASWFIIYADRPTRTISLLDNGNGITKAKFEEIFKNMGYGIQRKDKYSNSYFGLGLMSVLELGKRAKIITRSKEERKVIKLEVNSEKIFNEDMGDKHLKEIKKYLVVSSSDLSERELSVLSKNNIEDLFNEFPGHFTEIILEEIDKDIFETIVSDDFKKELRKILPLKIQNNEPFLASVKDDGAFEKWLKEIMNKKKFYPTIDIYFGISEGEEELNQLWKYYPEFKEDLEFGKADMVYDIFKDKNGKEKFAFYYLYSIEDLEKREKENTETGFWVRNRNFLVKEGDYFQKQGTRKKIIHEPLKNWLFGEIFHENMTDALIVTRDEYNWESSQFNEFYDEINNLLLKLNKDLREAWKNSKGITKSIIEPFIEVGGNKDPFNNTYDVLFKMGIIKAEEETENVLKKFDEHRIPELEKEEKSIYTLIRKNKHNIPLADDNKIKVIIDQNLRSDFIKQREEKSNRVIVRISPDIFSPKEVKFLGKTFTVFYIAGEDIQPGISVDSKNWKIYINPFNQDILKYSLSFIDVYIALEIADIYSETKKEMKSYLMELLGAKLTDNTIEPFRYLYSLKDELQRRQ